VAVAGFDLPAMLKADVQAIAREPVRPADDAIGGGADRGSGRGGKVDALVLAAAAELSSVNASVPR